MATETNYSRRNFFGCFPGTVASALVGSPATAPHPTRAWIILTLTWEYNDEFTYPDGSSPEPTVYFDPALAESACRRLCAEFYAAQTPQEFEVDFTSYPDVDPETATWEQLERAGSPAPYSVQELNS